MHVIKIKSWSPSRLVDYESCPLKAKLKYIDRIPEPIRPLPKGKTEHANDRGTRIHTAAEFFVKGTAELVPELETFREELTRLRFLYAAGTVSLEGEWAFTKEWSPTSWKSDDVWVRVKLDSFVRLSKTHGVVIDYKTGRRFGNEIKHAEQMQIYQLAAFLKYPELEKITVELWYTDQNELATMTFTRKQGLRFLENFTQRANKMTHDEVFTPRPNIISCKFCPFGKDGTQHCDKG
mgnify:CR=1 FL=1